MANTVGVAPANLRKLIDPRWFAWSTKHTPDHRDCDQAHDRAIFAAGFLIGGGEATRLAAQLNPALHDVARLLLLMQAADEEVRPGLIEAVSRLLAGERYPLLDCWSAVRTVDLDMLTTALNDPATRDGDPMGPAGAPRSSASRG